METTPNIQKHTQSIRSSESQPGLVLNWATRLAIVLAVLASGTGCATTRKEIGAKVGEGNASMVGNLAEASLGGPEEEVNTADAMMTRLYYTEAGARFVASPETYLGPKPPTQSASSRVQELVTPGRSGAVIPPLPRASRPAVPRASRRGLEKLRVR